MKKNSYSAKLRDPRWQRKRLEILERDKWCCSKCGNPNETLMVHHTKYEGSNPWETPDEYLLTLCQTCHHGHHYDQKKREKEFLDHFYSCGFLSSDLRQFAVSFKDYTRKTIPHLPEVVVAALNYHISNPELLSGLIDEYFEGLTRKPGYVPFDLGEGKKSTDKLDLSEQAS